MEKQANKARDIKFFSDKNGRMVTVHSMTAKCFAESAEARDDIAAYKTNVPLENWKDKISTIGIRTSYLDTEWTTDFMLVKKDSSIAIREIISHDAMEKKAEMEKLELSRRYWKAAHVTDWGIVLTDKEGAAW